MVCEGVWGAGMGAEVTGVVFCASYGDVRCERALGFANGKMVLLTSDFRFWWRSTGCMQGSLGSIRSITSVIP